MIYVNSFHQRCAWSVSDWNSTVHGNLPDFSFSEKYLLQQNNFPPSNVIIQNKQFELKL